MPKPQGCFTTFFSKKTYDDSILSQREHRQRICRQKCAIPFPQEKSKRPHSRAQTYLAPGLVPGPNGPESLTRSQTRGSLRHDDDHHSRLDDRHRNSYDDTRSARDNNLDRHRSILRCGKTEHIRHQSRHRSSPRCSLHHSHRRRDSLLLLLQSNYLQTPSSLQQPHSKKVDET